MGRNTLELELDTPYSEEELAILTFLKEFLGKVHIIINFDDIYEYVSRTVFCDKNKLEIVFLKLGAKGLFYRERDRIVFTDEGMRVLDTL